MSESASRWWRLGYPILLGALAVSVPLLVWLGIETILASTDGRLIRTVDDPAEPGYEALVEPTPVYAVIGLDSEGALDVVSVLSITDVESAAAILVPRATAVGEEVPGGTVAEAWDTAGEEGVRDAVGSVLNVQIDEARVVAPDDWTVLTEPVAPLELDNPDAVSAEDPAASFEPGPMQLPADQVGSYLSARTAPGESDLNRLVRHSVFWHAWLDAIGSNLEDPAVVPGESDVGLGLFLRSLGSVESVGEVDVVSLPLHSVEVPGAAGPLFEPEEGPIAELVARVIPFPLGSPPGARLRARVLDGTGELDNGVAALGPLVLGGAEISTVGNASEFGHTQTLLLYDDPADAERVAALAETLGVGVAESESEASEAIDVIVILGADALELFGGGAFEDLRPQRPEDNVPALGDGAGVPETGGGGDG